MLDIELVGYISNKHWQKMGEKKDTMSAEAVFERSRTT